MPGVGNEGCGPIMQWVPWGRGVVDLLADSLREKLSRIGGSGLSIELGVCCLDALAVDGGPLWIWGCPPSDPHSRISWGTEH